ncbi:hypothetical protein BDW74DRAFT_84818 [Aspergillus multicolor]|uniref:uncharacterized protein n=1 Tax=Aspergillus multicolor TaxID=41759 RepID=UPI003CCDC061
MQVSKFLSTQVPKLLSAFQGPNNKESIETTLLRAHERLLAVHGNFKSELRQVQLGPRSVTYLGHSTTALDEGSVSCEFAYLWILLTTLISEAGRSPCNITESTNSPHINLSTSANHIAGKPMPRLPGPDSDERLSNARGTREPQNGRPLPGRRDSRRTVIRILVP